ncbi:low molecular weight protein-tyrosine-phosphatase [Agathobacter ruminis]|uniref:protein-tyrosine-phosphatase n=1 Tax=Agathobacter ruminis TaxID=1712665 RepID=A0A2G3E301_9FIRM|nr:low molecular weight protein-tyrosine-phosphatase [Agathobacter ruminis]MDC7300278.1 low molecular weight phosphotyrosine protein phosphatase [Agathobacter ruminis]PHU37634.1 protein tyrosine phosphatase [Agathobacter ruminis]
MVKVLFICHGNICRSPMAEYIMKDILEKRGLQDRYEVASAATSTEEIWRGMGNPIYPPAQAELRKHGIGQTAYTDFQGKRARQVTRADYEYYDYILCAETVNVKNVLRITGPDTEGKVRRLLEDSACPRDIADPWYTGDFGATYRDIVEGVENFLQSMHE